MIESASAGEVNGSSVLLSGIIVRSNVGIAKVQEFLVIRAPSGMASDSRAEDEVCLVRYYDPVELSSLDPIDRALVCVKLRWSTRESEEFENADFGVDGRSAAVPDLSDIDVQPVSTIRDLVHVVRRDYQIRGTSAFSCLGTGWEHHWFYLNRFKQPDRDALYSAVDV
jgi:hypothetical protein